MSQKVVIITGASSGIGEAAVNRLIEDGHLVVAFARRAERLETLKEKWGGRIVTVTGDVTNTDDVKELVDQTIVKFGRIDVLVNNAGVGILAPLASGELKDWQQMINVNVIGVLNCLHTCLPHLIESKGHIFNIASVASHDVFPNAVVYCASKYAVNAITLGFRKEFRGDVKITNISPGTVETEFQEHSTDPGIKAGFEKSLQGPVIKSKDIADAISHILHLPGHLVVNEYIVRPNQ